MKELQNRLNLLLARIEDQKFLKSDGLGNEIGFWIFDYPAQGELLVREHLNSVCQKLTKRGHHFLHLNVFQVMVEMLESRNLFTRACQREQQVGLAALKRSLKGPLEQRKVAQFVAQKYLQQDYDFVLISGLGSAWPTIRGHELLSALQDVMGSTPMLMFYPGEYSGTDLLPFGIVESRNYYRAFKLVPEDGRKAVAE